MRPRLISILLCGLTTLTLPPRGPLQAAEIQVSRTTLTQFQPDQAGLDDNGVHINAHGGGLLFHEGTYYWFGEHKIGGDAAEVGVHCYSSVDLYNWTDRGVALSVSEDPQSEIAKGCIIQRPKVNTWGVKKFCDYGLQRLRGISAFTQQNGTFEEYKSPTYTMVALHELSRLKAHVQNDESPHLIAPLLRRTWEEWATHFHALTRQWAGQRGRSSDSCRG